MNYFELFDLPFGFIVDNNLLQKKYIELQKKYHPDFFTTNTQLEQDEALEKSSDINTALNILKNKDETIKYVLQQKGILQNDEKYQLPPLFLMEMMELNENADKNSIDIISKIEAEIYNEVKDIIENYTPNISLTNLLKVKEYYYKKKYLHRILDRIND